MLGLLGSRHQQLEVQEIVGMMPAKNKREGQEEAGKPSDCQAGLSLWKERGSRRTGRFRLWGSLEKAVSPAWSSSTKNTQEGLHMEQKGRIGHPSQACHWQAAWEELP